MFILAFLTGPLGKYVAIVAVIGTLLLGCFGYLKFKEHEAAQQALITFNQAQLEQTIKDNKAFQEKIDSLQKTADDLVKKNTDLVTVNQALLNQTNTVIDNTPDITLDPLFNTVLNHLRGNK